jgi:hypothetical protein
MAATVKVESESADDIDPLSSNNENEMLEVKHEKYLLPVVMPESEVGFVCSSFFVRYSFYFHACVYVYMIIRNCDC